MIPGSNISLFFSFTKPENFSGQTAASELIIESFTANGFNCIPILLYPLDRNSKNPIIRYIKLFLMQIKSLPNILKLAYTRNPILHLNLGQSYWSFIRVGIWYFPIRLLNRNVRVVTSLHGSVFMLWESSSLITKIFIKFLKSSKLITVLGENQKRKLELLGLSSDKIRVVPNSCNMNVCFRFIYRKKAF